MRWISEVLKNSGGLDCVQSKGPVRSEREAHTWKSRAERSSRSGSLEGAQGKFRRVFRSLLVLLVLLVLLSGCMVGPNYRRPRTALPVSWEEEIEGISESQEIEVCWWKEFDDPTLDWLISCALQRNLDIEMARQRILEAWALRKVACANLVPQVNGSGALARHRFSSNAQPGGVAADLRSLLVDSYQVGFDAIWELDLFGRNRRGVQVANAEIGAEIADGSDVIVSLLGEIGRNYVEVRGFQKRIRVAQQNIGVIRDVANIAEVRFEAGLANKLDYLDTMSLAHRAEAAVMRFEEQKMEGIYRLSVLLGMEAGALVETLETEEPVPTVPKEIPIGTPCDLIARRPDVRHAEWELRAASARIGIAVADLYPSVSLRSLAFLDSVKPTNLVEWNSRMWRLEAGLFQPIFQGGRLRARVEAQWASYRGSLADYRQTILLATEEVRNALVSFEQERRRYEELEKAITNSRESQSLSLELYTRGLVNFLFVLNAERAVIEIDDELIETETRFVESAVALYKALGGAWKI